MTRIFQFLTTLRTSPKRAVLLELGFIALGGVLLGLAFFGRG
jgi:hypothetical protein